MSEMIALRVLVFRPLVKENEDSGNEFAMLVAREVKRIFDGIKANLAEIQLKKHQNVQKTSFFCKKFQEPMG